MQVLLLLLLFFNILKYSNYVKENKNKNDFKFIFFEKDSHERKCVF